MTTTTTTTIAKEDDNNNKWMELRLRILFDPAADPAHPVTHRFLCHEWTYRPWPRSLIPGLARGDRTWMVHPDGAYALFVDYVVHTLHALVQTIAATVQPAMLSASAPVPFAAEGTDGAATPIHELAACLAPTNRLLLRALIRHLDLYHPLIDELNAVVSVDAVLACGRAWWCARALDARYSPDPLTMDRRPIAIFCRSLLKVICTRSTTSATPSINVAASVGSTDSATGNAGATTTTGATRRHTGAQSTVVSLHDFQEGVPTIGLFCAAWPQKHRTAIWIDKVSALIRSSERKPMRDNEFRAIRAAVAVDPCVEVDVTVSEASKRSATAAVMSAAAIAADDLSWGMEDESSAVSSGGNRHAVNNSKSSTVTGYRHVHTGMRMLRYLLQWACLFHLGAYEHSAVVLTHVTTRGYWCRLWHQLPVMGHSELLEIWQRLAHVPVVSLAIINEFMITCIHDNPALSNAMNTNAAWVTYARLCLFFVDQYRRTLPHPCEWVGVSSALQTFELRRREERQHDKRVREAKRKARLVRADAARLARQTTPRSATTTAAHKRPRLDGHAATRPSPKRHRADAGAAPRTFQLEVEEEVSATVETGTPTASSAGEEPDHYDEKFDAVDNDFIEGMNAIYGNPALTQFMVFFRSVHTVALATRRSADIWDALYRHFNAHAIGTLLSPDRRFVIFSPRYSDLKYAHARQQATRLPVESLRYAVRTALLLPNTASTAAAEWFAGETEDSAVVEPLDRVYFIHARRVVSFVCRLAHATAEGTRALTDLVRDHYSSARMTRPASESPPFVIKERAMRDLYRQHPYEYTLLYCAAMYWREWTVSWHVPLPAGTALRQYDRLCVLGGRYPEPALPGYDWLLYCTVCHEVHSLIDQTTASAANVPTVYSRRRASGFDDVYAHVSVHPDDADADAPQPAPLRLYCGHKSSRSTERCMTTPLKFMHLTGRLCMLRERMYMMCPNCTNIFECNPHTDAFNDHMDRICPTCSFRTRVHRMLAESSSAPIPTGAAAPSTTSPSNAANVGADAGAEEEDAEAVDAARYQLPSAYYALPRRLRRDAARYAGAYSSAEPSFEGPLFRLAEQQRILRATKSLLSADAAAPSFR